MPSPEETIEAIEKHLEENPNDASAWNTKGVILANMEEFGAALRSLERAIRLDPNLAEAHTNRGRMLLALGSDNAREALSSFDRALKIDPDNPVALRDKAIALRVLGRPKEELECIISLLELGVVEPRILLRKGDIELELGKFKEAVESYDKAIDMDDGLVAAYVHRAVALSMLEDWKDAIKSAKRATKLAPDDTETWKILGDVHLRAGKNRSAMKALKKASKIDPSDAAVENTMGMVAYKDGHLKEAVKHFRRAVIRKKDYKSALRNMALIYMELEDWEDAIDAWKRFISIVRNDPDAYDALAIAYARLDDFCPAHEAWKRARKLYKKRGDTEAADRVTKLGRAARINCSRQKKALKEQREHEKATRSFRDRFELRRKKKKRRRR